MDLKLVGKIAIVTGTGSQVGFGRGIAMVLAGEGCDVICCDIDIEGSGKTVEDVKELGRRATAIKVDITSRADVDAAVRQVLDEYGRIDILVNCAGRSSGLRPFVETSEEQWDIDFTINTRGTMNFTRAVLPHMLENKYGKIVNFSTHAANQPTGLAGAASYCAAKAATTVFSKTLSGEVGHLGINVNVIAPGPGATKFHMTGGGDPSMGEMVEKLAESGLTTTPEDIGNAVAFLVSDISKKFTGQVFEVSAAMGPRR